MANLVRITEKLRMHAVLIILEAIDLAFGDSVEFSGLIHGLVAFIVVVTAIIIAEQTITKIYHSLA